MVELAGHKGAGDFLLCELVPQRLHHPRTHASERAGEACGAALEALRAHLGDISRSSSFQSSEKRKRAPVVDASLYAVARDPLGQRLISLTSSRSRITTRSYD